ncbi:hypothetical protein HDU76_011366 [Blyttiomyces sp. JEL0837]|nr:hypothetical protein HDU76_011366 [Blyttiomyces sp. JEL0837]
MSSQTCGQCQRTVYVTEKVDLGGRWIHKGCLKCDDESCHIQLNLKTFKQANGGIWCEKHVPKHKAASVTDSVAEKRALAAPKKAPEGLHRVLVGTGETPTYGLDSIATQHALAAPKKQAENLGFVHKGDAKPVDGSTSTLTASHDNIAQDV